MGDLQAFSKSINARTPPHSSRVLIAVRSFIKRCLENLCFQPSGNSLTGPDTFSAGHRPLSGSYNLVVAFGVLHHIYHYDFRYKFLEWCTQHLSPNGYFVVSAWDFGRHGRFRQKAASSDVILAETGIDPQSLEAHDYFLSLDRGLPHFAFVIGLTTKKAIN